MSEGTRSFNVKICAHVTRPTTTCLPTMILSGLVSFVTLTAAAANPLPWLNVQLPFDVYQNVHPGFYLDLGARRLVQMEGKEPVWMTELEKVDQATFGSLFSK
jgi:hypothetical protein